MPGGSLGSLFTDGRGCEPTWIVVWPGASQHCWVGPDFPKMATSREVHANVYSQELCLQCPFPTSHIHPVFTGYPPRTTVRSDTDSHGVFALPWDPVHVKICVHFSGMGSLFSPSLVEFLHTSSTGLQCQMLWGLFLPGPDPQVRGFDRVLRTLIPIGESL